LKIGRALGIGTGTVQRVVMSSRALSTSTSMKRRSPLSETERTGYGVTVPLMRERSRNDLGLCRA
jgi:hypothetical protein